MRPNCIYIGCFVDPQELAQKTAHLRQTPLSRTIDEPHITFAFRPKQIEDALFGETVDITLVGYGNDGENEGFSVELSTENPHVEAMFREIDTPHITIAVSETGKPVNTRNLEFSSIGPICLKGTFGGYLSNGKVQLQPFQKQ